MGNYGLAGTKYNADTGREPIIRAPEPGEFPESWADEIARYGKGAGSFLYNFLFEKDPESLGTKAGQSLRGALGTATMAMAPMPGKSGPRWMRSPEIPGPYNKPQRATVTPELYAAAKAGDEAARSTIVDALQDMVAKTARRYLKPGRPTAEFEDLMAEGNIAILNVLDRKDPQAFLPYVQGAIERRLQNFQRGQGFRARNVAPIEAAAGAEDVSARMPDIPRRDLNQILNSAMGKLTEKERQVVEYRLGLLEEIHAEGATTREIAGNLGISQNAVMQRLKSGLGKLNKELRAAGIEPADLMPPGSPAPTETRVRASGKKGVSLRDQQPEEPATDVPQQQIDQRPTPPPPTISGGSGPLKAQWANYQQGFKGPTKEIPGFNNYHLAEDFTDKTGKVWPKGTTLSEQQLTEMGIPFEPPLASDAEPVRQLRPIAGGAGSELGDTLERMKRRLASAGGSVPPPNRMTPPVSREYESQYEPGSRLSRALAMNAVDDADLAQDIHPGAAVGGRAVLQPITQGPGLSEYMRQLWQRYPEALENY